MEIYECCNCYKRDTLTPHGKCSHCGSAAVISLHKIRQVEGDAILNDLFSHHELEVLFGIVSQKVGRA